MNGDREFAREMVQRRPWPASLRYEDAAVPREDPFLMLPAISHSPCGNAAVLCLQSPFAEPGP